MNCNCIFLFQRSRVCAYDFMIYLCTAAIYFGQVEQKTSNLREITLRHFYYDCVDCEGALIHSQSYPWKHPGTAALTM